MEGAKNTEST